MVLTLGDRGGARSMPPSSAPCTASQCPTTPADEYTSILKLKLLVIFFMLILLFKLGSTGSTFHFQSSEAGGGATLARLGQECGVRGVPETMAVLDWMGKATPPSELCLAKKLRPLCPIRLTFVDYVRES